MAAPIIQNPAGLAGQPAAAPFPTQAEFRQMFNQVFRCAEFFQGATAQVQAQYNQAQIDIEGLKRNLQAARANARTAGFFDDINLPNTIPGLISAGAQITFRTMGLIGSLCKKTGKVGLVALSIIFALESSSSVYVWTQKEGPTTKEDILNPFKNTGEDLGEIVGFAMDAAGGLVRPIYSQGTKRLSGIVTGGVAIPAEHLTNETFDKTSEFVNNLRSNFAKFKQTIFSSSAPSNSSIPEETDATEDLYKNFEVFRNYITGKFEKITDSVNIKTEEAFNFTTDTPANFTKASGEKAEEVVDAMPEAKTMGLTALAVTGAVGLGYAAKRNKNTLKKVGNVAVDTISEKAKALKSSMGFGDLNKKVVQIA